MIYPPLSWSTSLLFSQGQGKEGVALAGSLISFTDSFLPAKGPGRLPRLAWHGFVPVALDHRSDPHFKVILKGELHPRDPRTQARRGAVPARRGGTGGRLCSAPRFPSPFLQPSDSRRPCVSATATSSGKPGALHCATVPARMASAAAPHRSPGGQRRLPTRCRWPGLTPAEGRRTCSEPGPGRGDCLLPQRARCLGRTRHPEQAGPDRQLGTEPSRARLAQV